MVALSVAGNKIVSTLGHPFWEIGKGWTMAMHLHEGSMLHSPHGPVTVEAIEELPVRKEWYAFSYNLVVDDFHTYLFCRRRTRTGASPDRLVDLGRSFAVGLVEQHGGLATERNDLTALTLEQRLLFLRAVARPSAELARHRTRSRFAFGSARLDLPISFHQPTAELVHTSFKHFSERRTAT